MAEAREEEGALPLFLDETRSWVDAELDRRLPPEDAHPARLHAAMRYAVFGGGKRLRPALARLVCRELGGRDEDVAAAAASLELVHTYSLVHDDLPCMDDDELRRGRPTVHVAFDEATAVLVGDALLTLAFGWLAAAPRAADQVAALAAGAGDEGMVGGQVVDLASDGRHADVDEVRDLHERKTAALFAAAAEMGAIAAAAAPDVRALAKSFGRALGLCFQATDDVLDVTGDAATLGKTPGKDAALERGTLVAALGVEGARREARALASEAARAGKRLGWRDGDLGLELVGLVLARRT